MGRPIMAGEPTPAIETSKNTQQVYEKEKLELAMGANVTVDYTGSAAKTDPAEIKLVRKIDWRLMVSLIRKMREGGRRD